MNFKEINAFIYEYLPFISNMFRDPNKFGIFLIIFIIILLGFNHNKKIEKYLMFLLFCLNLLVLNSLFFGNFIQNIDKGYGIHGISYLNKNKINDIETIENLLLKYNNNRYIVFPGYTPGVKNKNDKFYYISPFAVNNIISYISYIQPGLEGGRNNDSIKIMNNIYKEYQKIGVIKFVNNLKKYGINYILLHKNLYVDNGSNFKISILKLEKDLIRNRELISVYNGKNEHLFFVKHSNKIINKIFFKKSLVEYNIKLSLNKNDEIIFLNSYSEKWKLYLKNQQGLFTPPLFENTHKKIYDYANSWTISKQGIIDYVNKYYSDELKKEGYPKKLPNGQLDYKYYKLNPDGSINTELTLYFKPQSYFYLGILISGTTFLLLILFLIFSSIRNKKNIHLSLNNKQGNKQ